MSNLAESRIPADRSFQELKMRALQDAIETMGEILQLNDVSSIKHLVRKELTLLHRMFSDEDI